MKTKIYRTLFGLSILAMIFSFAKCSQSVKYMHEEKRIECTVLGGMDKLSEGKYTRLELYIFLRDNSTNHEFDLEVEPLTYYKLNKAVGKQVAFNLSKQDMGLDNKYWDDGIWIIFTMVFFICALIFVSPAFGFKWLDD